MGLLLHPLPQGVSILPIDIDLAEEVKVNIVTLSKLLDLLLCSWFLRRDHIEFVCGCCFGEKLQPVVKLAELVLYLLVCTK